MSSKSAVLCILSLVSACGDDGAPVQPDAGAGLPDAPELETIDDWCPGQGHCTGAGGDGVLYVGVDKQPIMPTLVETEWDDQNMNHKWETTESFTDVNGNGEFDAYWIAGYSNGVPCKGFHDPLEARAMAFRWNDVHVAIAYIDAVGLFIDDMDRIKADPQLEGLDLDHVIIGSTHVHDSIDTVGLWGPQDLVSGVKPDHQAYIRSQVALAIKNAVMAERAARLRVARVATVDPSGSTLSYVGDQRDPVVVDPYLTVMQFADASTDETIGTLANWASHPGWIDPPANPDNLASADYVYWLRKGLEDGVPETAAGAAATGLGGITVFVQGPLGGQVGTEKVDPIDPVSGDPMLEEGFPAAEQVGTDVARFGLEALAGPDAEDVTTAMPIGYRTAQLYARVDNVFYHVLVLTGIGDRELFLYDPHATIDEDNIPYVRSRTTYLQIGPVAIITAPGELVPELWVGGYDGAWSWGEPIVEETVNTPDFAMAPAPPYLRDLMLENEGVRYTFVAGLAEDFLGYIVARFNFVLDPSNPYITEAEGDHYEETNSIGPYAEEQLQHPMMDLARWRPPGN